MEPGGQEKSHWAWSTPLPPSINSKICQQPNLRPPLSSKHAMLYTEPLPQDPKVKMYVSVKPLIDPTGSKQLMVRSTTLCRHQGTKLRHQWFLFTGKTTLDSRNDEDCCVHIEADIGSVICSRTQT